MVILMGTGVIAVFFWALLILIFCNAKRVRTCDLSPLAPSAPYLRTALEFMWILWSLIYQSHTHTYTHTLLQSHTHTSLDTHTTMTWLRPLLEHLS